MSKFQKTLIYVLIIIGIIVAFSWQFHQTEIIGDDDLLFFYHPSCPHCADEKPFLDTLEEKYEVTFSRYDVSVAKNKELYLEHLAKYNITTQSVPFTIIGNKSLLGFDTEDTTGKVIEAHLQNHLGDDTVVISNESTSQTTQLEDEFAFLGDLSSYSLPVLAIILGLLDGFNPCAMWVLIVLIGFVSQLQDKRKIWLLVGSFVAASGILYFLFMTAWLNAFLFLGSSKIVLLIVGLLAIWFGITSIKNFITKEDTQCHVGDAKKKKKTVDRMKSLVNAPITWASVGGIIILAFIVNSIEFACSSGIPAVFTQLLAISGVSTLTQYLYIILYVFFFMFDDLIIFGIAAFAISKTAQTGYLRYSNIIGGVLLLLLGIVLVFFPGLLTAFS